MNTRRWFACSVGASIAWIAASLSSRAADSLPIVDGVEAQPLKAQVKRVAEALDFLGAPLTKDQQAALAKAIDDKDAGKKIQETLDPLCLAGININPESRVLVVIGPAAKRLMQHGWRVFLVKVHNAAGINPELKVTSPNAAPLYVRSSGNPDPPLRVKPKDVPNRWLDVEMFNGRPLNKELSRLPLEYRVIQLYSRDAGQREAKLSFNVGHGTQDIGFRGEVDILFDCDKAVPVTVEVVDHDGTPTTGQFIVRDALGRIYPSRARRLAPDFFFHDQVYRHSGETIDLPPGQYHVTYTRGPEYKILSRKITVPNEKSHKEVFRLARWIKLADRGWYSGDHHVHAAGCAHYEAPTQGVTPEAMMRHILGEDLNIGCVLSWGPCWYFQKQFFNGQVSELSKDKHLMRYDVEVSGFPSSHAGHLCLLRLKDDDYSYPTDVEFDWNYGGERGRFTGRRTEKIGQWPSWDQPVLQWGQKQGAVVGYSHSGWGLQVRGNKLPSYEMPPFDGIGANEYIVSVVHGACDFISAVDTPIIYELSIWYHTLNCGYTCRISGETDFPCIYGERVGLGRAYVKLDSKGKLDYNEWANGIKDGRSYCTDGLSHLIDFKVNGLGVGEKGAGGKASVLAVKKDEKLKVTVQAAAMLEEKPREDIRRRALAEKPYWHVERARIGNTRKVPVELIVNGQSVETKEIDADGRVADLTFDYTPTKSSWVAVRIFPTAHTNPVFVEVAGQPIRASKKSAQWCLGAVDVCWNSKMPAIRQGERKAAAEAYDGARAAYRKILAESAED